MGTDGESISKGRKVCWSDVVENDKITKNINEWNSSTGNNTSDAGIGKYLITIKRKHDFGKVNNLASNY